MNEWLVGFALGLFIALAVVFIVAGFSTFQDAWERAREEVYQEQAARMMAEAKRRREAEAEAEGE